MRNYMEEFINGKFTITVNNMGPELKRLGMPTYSSATLQHYDKVYYDTTLKCVCGGVGSRDYVHAEDFVKGVDDYNKSNGGKNMSKKSRIMTKEMLRVLGVERVLFNGPATIVFLKDGTKGVAVCSTEDEMDSLIGFSVAYTTAVATKGNKSNLKDNVDFMVKKGSMEVK